MYPKKTQNRPQQNTTLPYEIFFLPLSTIKVLSRRYVEKFIRKQTVLKKKKKITKKKTKMALSRGEHNSEKFSTVTIGVKNVTKNVTKFYEKGLNSFQEIEQYTLKGTQK